MIDEQAGTYLRLPPHKLYIKVLSLFVKAKRHTSRFIRKGNDGKLYWISYDVKTIFDKHYITKEILEGE